MRTKVTYSLTEDRIISTLSPFRVSPHGRPDREDSGVYSTLIEVESIVSLTSVVDPVEILARHFGESMFICYLLPMESVGSPT